MTRADILDALANIERRMGECSTFIERLVDENGRELYRRVTRTPGRESLILTRHIVSPKKEEQEQP